MSHAEGDDVVSSAKTPRRQNARPSQAIVAIAKEHIENPRLIPYRETYKGSQNIPELTKWKSLILALPPMTKAGLKKVLMQVAEENEDTWHLANDKEDYAEKMSRRIRVMKRDIGQNLLKYKKAATPDWLKPFVSMDTSTVPEEDEQGEDDDGDKESPGESVTEETVKAHVEKKKVAWKSDIEAKKAGESVIEAEKEVGNAKVGTGADDSKGCKKVTHLFGWDTDLQVAAIFIQRICIYHDCGSMQSHKTYCWCTFCHRCYMRT